MSWLSNDKLAVVMEDYFASLKPEKRLAEHVNTSDIKTLRDAIELQSMKALELLRKYLLEVPCK